ncbi:MAG TPA: M14 family metallopeptidase, partial [Myxococcaceae bacterium]|nr:M14 family metallopeptidase [Myxococcaceae bacterium]
MTPITLTLALAFGAAGSPLSTVAERSGFRQTGRYSEVLRLCGEFARAHSARVRCSTFGTTPEGRPMKVLVASEDGALTPESARRRGRPVLLAIGGIHAGEIDGKDAGFLLARELLQRAIPGNLLRQVTFVFVPVFNVDGHERFGPGPHHRPNQRGPEETGWRTTGQNLNLNRDWVKAEAPEMQAMLALMREWDPIAVLDLHVTDGARFEHDVAVLIEPSLAGPEALKALGLKAREKVFARLTALGHLPLPFYPSLEDETDPSSGFSVGVAPPRFSQAYVASRNRFGVLVETHSWKEYPARVRATRDVVLAYLESTAADGRAWMEAARKIDAQDSAGDSAGVVLTWQRGKSSKTIAFRGYAYTREKSDVSGQHWVRYDESKPQLWRVPYFDEVVPGLTVRAPRAGYIVPAAHAALVSEKLRTHGFRFRTLRSAEAREVEVFRAAEVKLAPTSFEGRQGATLSGAWWRERVDLAPGSLFVP